MKLTDLLHWSIERSMTSSLCRVKTTEGWSAVSVRPCGRGDTMMLPLSLLLLVYTEFVRGSYSTLWGRGESESPGGGQMKWWVFYCS